MTWDETGSMKGGFFDRVLRGVGRFAKSESLFSDCVTLLLICIDCGGTLNRN